jgi:serine/threonine protein kinase
MTLEKPAVTAAKLGNYELLKEQPGIGVGATWVARTAGDTSEGAKLFAVLRVPKHLTKKQESIDGLIADTLPAKGFRHDHVVGLVDVGSHDGEAFLAFEHHDGEPLAALITAAGAQGLPTPVALRIVLDALSGLQAAHTNAAPLFHGEIGPQHLVVGEDGVTRVGGLVSARALSRIVPSIGARNHDRLSYAAPERVKTLSSATPAAPTAVGDVFSIGVVLWELIAKQRLFTSKIEAAIVQKVLSAPIASLASLTSSTSGSVPTEIVDLVAKALDRNPAHRVATAADLRAGIEGLGADSIASAKDVAAEVERLVGKVLATRKADVRAEITRRANVSKGAASIPPPAPTKPIALAPRKSTLLGIATMKPAVPSSLALPPLPAFDKIEEPVAPPTSASAASASSGVPSEPRPLADSIDLEDIAIPSAPKAAVAPPAPPAPTTPRVPAVPRRPAQTLMMGAAVLDAAKAAAKEPVKADKAEKPATAEKPKAEPEAAATAKPAVPAPALKPAAHVDTGKTSPTPASDPSRKNFAVEKVGPGSTLGRYEILMPVARGGMASVWAAKLPGSRGFQKIFAIKTMLPDVSDDPEFESMFLDEGRVAARIRHPNVVEIIDLGESADVLYLVMEWVEGENLGALVKAARALGGVPMPIILRIASQICAGLHAAHELRDDDGNLLELVHRDVSPANVLVSSSGFVKIVDFGIAKSKGRLHVTRVGGMVKGKTPYLSPEQLGQQPVDRRSDIFSLGVMLYVLATGLHPFRGDTDGKTIENIALREPVPLRALQSDIPTEFEAIVLKALAKDPKDRFSTAGELQRAIDQLTGTLGMSTTEEDVAAFVRKALHDTLTKRAQDLRAAIEGADGRGAGADAEGLGKGRASDTGAAARIGAAALAESVKESAKEPAKPQAAKPNESSDASALVASAASTPVEEPKPKEAEAAPPVAATSRVELPKPAARVEGDEPPVEQDVSFEASETKEEAKSAPSALPAVAVAKPPERAELDLVFTPPPPPPPDLSATEESSSRPVTRPGVAADLASDLEHAPAGLAPKRRPTGLIAIGAVAAVCALVGVLALAGGSKKDAPAPGATASPQPTQEATATNAPAPPPPATPTATTGATAEPAATAEPTQPTATPTADPTPTKATGRAPANPPAVTPTRPSTNTKPKQPKKPTYNPGSL